MIRAQQLNRELVDEENTAEARDTYEKAVEEVERAEILLEDGIDAFTSHLDILEDEVETPEAGD